MDNAPDKCLRPRPRATAAALLWAMLIASGCQGPAATTPASQRRPAEGSLLSQARQIVIEGLTSSDPQIRANAVEVVATTGELTLIPRVRTLLLDPTVPVRFLAILAIADLRYEPAANDMATLLSDGNQNIRIAAAYALTRLGAGDYFQLFRDAVASEDQTVRANAALLLGKSGRQEALRFLYWALRDRDSADKVVLQAAESIAMLGDERIYPKLWTRLISAYADDRVIGIRAMGALGTEQAKNAIVGMLDDSVLEVRLAAAEQLGRLGEPVGGTEVLEALRDHISDEANPQAQTRAAVLAALAIGEIGTPALTKYLPQLLQAPSPSVRLAAAKAVLVTTER